MGERIWTRSHKHTCEKRRLISSYLSPRLSAWNNSDATVHISLKFYTWEFTKLRRPIRVVWLKQDKNERHFAWRRTYIYVVGFYNSCILFSMSYKLKSKKPLPICTQPRVTNEFKSVEQSMSLRYGENLKEQQSEGARNIMYCVHFLSCLYCLYELTELLWPRWFCCHFVRHLELALVNRNKHKSDTLNTNIYTF